MRKNTDKAKKGTANFKKNMPNCQMITEEEHEWSVANSNTIRTILTYPGTNSEFVGNQRKRTLVSNYTDCTKREMKTKAEVDYRNKLSFLSWKMMQA